MALPRNKMYCSKCGMKKCVKLKKDEDYNEASKKYICKSCKPEFKNE